MIEKQLSRKELQRRIEALQRDLKRVTAILYKHDRMISVLLIAHPSYSTGWSYTPSLTGAFLNTGGPAAIRHESASSLNVASLQQLYDHKMTVDLLAPL
jgi:hypothetical protein